MLVVNVASKCGLTPQYTALQKLASDYADRGLTVIGVPCNQFMGQEPGSAEEIKTFCSTTYGVTFPLLEKTDVNGAGRHPLYEELTKTPDGDGRRRRRAVEFREVPARTGRADRQPVPAAHRTGRAGGRRGDRGGAAGVERAPCDTLRMVVAIARPKLEGNIAVGEDRQIGFAEFGAPQGRAIFWLHGTPGARRQIPMEARVFAEREHIRLIGIDRPGIGSSTPHQYETVADVRRRHAHDRRHARNRQDGVVGLSGGGPYTLACAAAMPERVVVAGVVGGVAPVSGPDRIGGGLMALGSRVAPLLEIAGAPIRLAAMTLIQLIRPVAGPAADIYGLMSPPADRRLLARPEIKAMFLDDLLNGSRKQLAAPFYDIVAFARDWGFRLDEVKVPVRWWHGDADHIIPFSHGEHVVSRLPDAQFHPMPGESHLGGLGRAEEILRTMIEVWDRDALRP